MFTAVWGSLARWKSSVLLWTRGRKIGLETIQRLYLPITRRLISVVERKDLATKYSTFTSPIKLLQQCFSTVYRRLTAGHSLFREPKTLRSNLGKLKKQECLIDFLKIESYSTFCNNYRKYPKMFYLEQTVMDLILFTVCWSRFSFQRCEKSLDHCMTTL